VKTDVLTKAITGIILQQVSSLNNTKKHWYPIVFWSRKLQPTKKNYITYNQELLAIVNCFKE
jgi:hypothetical protein